MTSDTIHRMANAIVISSDPFERAVNEVLAEPVFRWPHRLRDEAFMHEDALKVELDVRWHQILRDYAAALAGGADPDDCFMQCAEGLAQVAGVDTEDEFAGERDFTFGKIQYVINRAEALAYIDYFWDYLGGCTVEIDERRLENWFLAPDSPRNRFRGCHCLMDDVTMGRAVRDYRKAGTNEVIAKSRWEMVAWRRIGFLENGMPNSIIMYDHFQYMVAKLTEPKDLFPLEFLFYCIPGKQDGSSCVPHEDDRAGGWREPTILELADTIQQLGIEDDEIEDWLVDLGITDDETFNAVLDVLSERAESFISN